MRDNSPRRDRILLVAVLFLNTVSGFTTIFGLTQIFPIGVAILSGIAIQLNLFLLCSGFAGKYAPVRRWLAVFSFSAISIYSSFFAYYATLAGNIYQHSPSEAKVLLLTPFLKLMIWEAPAIASAIMAILVDGLIVLMGISIEIKTRTQITYLPTQENENESLVETYLRKLVRQAQLMSVLFVIVGVLYLIAGWQLGFNISFEIPLLLACVLVILHARNAFLKYRISSGIYGNNYYEAKELIAFLENEYNGKGKPPRGGRNAFPEVVSNNEASISDGITGEAT